MSTLREVVLDTETTGLSPRDGHRVIEIGCVELINKVKTGRVFHTYLNPERPVEEKAFAVHGLSDQFLASKPLFKSIAKEFLQFLDTSNLIIHNAAFDMQFLNHELASMALPVIPMYRAVDTLVLARKKFPGAQASLDALCRRFNISLHTRDKHGALIDSELLALVYIRMSGHQQSEISFGDQQRYNYGVKYASDNYRRRSFTLSDLELNMHQEMLKKIKDPLFLAKKP